VTPAPTGSGRAQRRALRHVGILAASGLATLGALLAGCGGTPESASVPVLDASFPVEVTPAQAQSFTTEITAPGSLEPFESQMISARVSGVIEKMLVSEGDVIHAGEAIAEIEPERYAISVESARAAVERAEAVEADAKAAAGRRAGLEQTAPNLVNPEEVAQYKARASQAHADLLSTQAALERAQLDLLQAHVTAPMAGVIQARLSQTGQYAQVGTAIASVVQRDPMRLHFAVPVQLAGGLAHQQVRFSIPGGAQRHLATVNFIAEQADPATRLVTVFAVVADGGADLVPGAFAEVTADIGSAHQAVVVPENAVRPSERGFLVYVVVPSPGSTPGADAAAPSGRDSGSGIAHERLVEVENHTSHGGIALRSGVASGELIVVHGAQSLHDGAQVRIVPGEAGPDTAPSR
jgi:multidrug efflux system membrane fusion protein